MISIIIHGANGTMGRMLAETALKMPESYRIAAGVDKFPPEKNQFPFPIYPSFEECPETSDVIIDFSLAAALPTVIKAAVERKTPLIVATTGLGESDIELIREAGNTIPVLQSANMSLGVNLQVELIKRAASLLGDGYDIEILEKHHNRKVDAPSGTAEVLAKALMDVSHSRKHPVYSRHETRHKREKSEIGISSIRGGTVVGTHNVGFYGEDEIIEINHIALSRRIFAVGALRSAKMLLSLPPRLYSFAELVSDSNSVTNIFADEKQAIVNLPAVEFSTDAIASVFETISAAGVNVDMISQSAPQNGSVALSFTLPVDQLPKAREALDGIAIASFCKTGVTKLAIEGSGMEYQHGIAARVFRTLADANIPACLVTTSDTIIQLCVEDKYVDAAASAIAKAFDI